MFVGRRLDGSIYGMWTCQEPNDAYHPDVSELPDTHADVITFISQLHTTGNAALAAAIDSASNLPELKAAVKQALRL